MSENSDLIAMHGAYLRFLTHMHDRARANARVNGAYLSNKEGRLHVRPTAVVGERCQ